MNKVDVRAKLAALGLELPVAAKPVAAYVPAIRTGNLVLSREAKKRREAAEAFEGAGHTEKAALEKAEGEVIAKYLPAQLSADEIKQIIAEAIASTGAAGPADMGKVMGAIKPKIAGKADGALVSSLVKESLNK